MKMTTIKRWAIVRVKDGRLLRSWPHLHACILVHKRDAEKRAQPPHERVARVEIREVTR